MRVVFDTNIWVDWFYFNDINIAPLKALQKQKHIEIVIDDACLSEAVSVLRHTRFLGKKTEESVIGNDIKALCTFVDTPTLENTKYWCKDPDDIKFLSLAGHHSVAYLITKDLHLLKRKNRRVFGDYKINFSIVNPNTFRITVQVKI
ncbi:MAG: putative toxin-antitoxin system toxin component, PIN family [Proteobacteria bacterium]|nr:putative toxin-antitoxin system toxin component, PIN family [Pseudomonadota bacterium]MDA1331943.1 putative toxin-antitoxin system toxin component, PIN family [Pseudomonadota bacterium]